MKWLLAMSVLAGAATAQVTPYGLKVETGPGLVAITFSTQQSQVRAYFPDDVAAGESFSGALEGQPNYVLEFAGQRARVRDGVFHWTMPGTGPAAEPGLQPADAAPQFVPLILRDFRGHEVARASIPVAEKRPGFPSFRLPKFVHAGSPAPVLGPFDGDAESSSFVIDGKPAQVLAESVRKMVVRAPEQVLGPVPFTMKKGEIERGGILRSLQMDTSTPDHATLGISVKGLRGLQDEIPLRLESDYIFIRPADVGAEGDFHTQVALLGIESNVSEMEARLVFPQTPRDEVGLILRTPRKDRRQDVAQEHAAALRLLDFDVLPVLQDFIADYDVGSDAAYAMLAADEQRALPLLLGSMPFSGPNVERIGFVWILSHFDAAKPNASAREAHAAAVRVLGVPASSSEAVELALHTLGVSGSAEDLPLLDQHYQYRNGWSGLRRIQDASEAALARLGSRPHLENIRTELAATVTADSTPDRAVRIGQVLQKAGFAGQPELLPAVCRHLGDPAITDIDVTWDPKLSAVAALNAIVNHTTPMARPDRRTLEEWKSYCRQPGAR